MKKFLICTGILAIMLALSLAPAMAVEPKDNAVGCTDPSCYSGQYRFVGYNWSQYPGSTQICSTWIPPHWVPYQDTIPGKVMYRPIWIPPRQITRYRWQEGFWQSTGTHMRPDVYMWQSQQWPRLPSQTDFSQQGGYFNAYGMWIPQR